MHYVKLVCQLLTFSLVLLLISSCGDTERNPVQHIPSPGSAESAHSRLPYLTSDSTGAVFLSWVESDAASGRSAFYYAGLAANMSEWETPHHIASSDEWFVNWADFPSILSKNGAVTAAHTLKKVPGNTYSYNVNLYLMGDSAEWQPPFTPHFDDTPTEHGFVSLASWQSETWAWWLDGRRTHNRSDEEYSDITKAMTLRAASISSDGTVDRKYIIDESVCDCCNTSVAVTARGPIVAYRNRTDTEIRDIYTSYYYEGEWSTPRPVHNDGWQIAACPVNGPAIAAHDSTVVIAWYTAAGSTPAVKAATSTDYGSSFSDPVTLNTAVPAGRVDAVIDGDGHGYISWLEQSGSSHALQIKRITPDKDTSAALNIVEIAASRKSGFPQLAVSGDKLIMAWTHIDSSGSYGIRTAAMPANALR